jgi:hypothetical protein
MMDTWEIIKNKLDELAKELEVGTDYDFRIVPIVWNFLTKTVITCKMWTEEDLENFVEDWYSLGEEERREVLNHMRSSKEIEYLEERGEEEEECINTALDNAIRDIGIDLC